jgi:hypothetical protein
MTTRNLPCIVHFERSTGTAARTIHAVLRHSGQAGHEPDEAAPTSMFMLRFVRAEEERILSERAFSLV